MRVFVTGATGYVGARVTRELLEHGHQVLGLARSDAGAEALIAAGAQAHRGDLTDPASLAEGAAQCDGVAHLAFIHDFSKFAENAAIELEAIKAMVQALAGTGKPLITTSGTLRPGLGRPLTEDDAAPADGSGGPRSMSEVVTLGAAGQAVRGQVVRLPQVHDVTDTHGFIPHLINAARMHGYAAYLGDGANRWAGVHLHDAARVYRLALERGAAGSCWHAVAEAGVPTRVLAETIGQGLGLPVKSLPRDQAFAYFGFLGMFAGVDAPVSTEKTRAGLDWAPREIGWIEDLKANYFNRQA